MEEEVVALVVKAIVVVAELEMERVLMTARRGNFMVVASAGYGGADVSGGCVDYSLSRYAW